MQGMECFEISMDTFETFLLYCQAGINILEEYKKIKKIKTDITKRINIK